MNDFTCTCFAPWLRRAYPEALDRLILGCARFLSLRCLRRFVLRFVLQPVVALEPEELQALWPLQRLLVCRCNGCLLETQRQGAHDEGTPASMARDGQAPPLFG